MPLPRARAIAIELAARDPEDLRLRPQTRSAHRLFAPTGGVPVDEHTLNRLRTMLEEISADCRYPSSPGPLERRRFDNAVLRLLGDEPIPAGEAIRAETWAWVAVALVPHLVLWRWRDKDGKIDLKRFAGSVMRNAIGRLWFQAWLLDRGGDHPERWALSDILGADQVVALLERPSLSANRDISHAVVTSWARLSPSRRTERVFREAMKGLIVRDGIQRLDTLHKDQVAAIAAACFDRAQGGKS